VLEIVKVKNLHFVKPIESCNRPKLRYISRRILLNSRFCVDRFIQHTVRFQSNLKPRKEVTMADQEAQEAVEQESEEQEAGTGAEVTLRNHIIGSMGVGLIPVPVVDLVALSGIQLNMLRKLAQSYDIPFSKDIVKNIIASLIGGGIPVTFAGALASLMKAVPIVGQATGALAMPILAGATTYAMGKVFIQHFASGGTFLNFDPDEVRDYYYEMYKEGQGVVSELKKGEEKKEKK
jgi:uncharacterized protein (DUF697 family)